MKKKVFALLLCGAMVAGTLAGCGNTSTETSKPAASNAPASSSATSSAAPESSAPAEEPAEPVELTWLGYYTSPIAAAQDTWAEKILEETFNVDITVVDDVTKENIDVFISSGEIVDITRYPTYMNGDMSYMYKQGMIREFPEEWLYEYYPTGMQIVTDFLGEEFFEKGYHKVDGKVLCVPRCNTYAREALLVLYRKDWLENLGLKEPTTLEEYHDMLYAFTYDDPDGNGKDDTYGTDCLLSNYNLWPVMGAFGFSTPKIYCLDDDGNVVYNGATEEYRQALGILQEWYAEGIIDQESVTDDRNAKRSKWASGKLGSIVDNVSWSLSERGAASVIGMVEEAYGEGVVGVLGPMTTEYGDGKVYTAYNFGNVFANHASVFTSSATDEQIIAVLKILEGLASDTELAVKILYGEEGVDHTINEDGQLIVSSDLSIEAQAAKGIGDYFSSQLRSEELNYITMSKADLEMLDKVYAQPYVVGNEANGFTSSIVNEAYKTYNSEVDKIMQEFFYNAMSGKKNLDADWDAYIADLNKAGLDKIIAEYQEKLN